MLLKIKNIIETIPEQECVDYYCYFTEICESTNITSYREHLLAKVRDTCKHHKINGELMALNEFRAYNMFAWLECMQHKYNI